MGIPLESCDLKRYFSSVFAVHRLHWKDKIFNISQLSFFIKILSYRLLFIVYKYFEEIKDYDVIKVNY